MNISQDYELTRLDKLRNYQAVLKEVKSLVKSIDPEARIISLGQSYGEILARAVISTS